MFGHSLIILHEKVQYILIVYIYTRACITSILQYHQIYDGKNNCYYNTAPVLRDLSVLLITIPSKRQQLPWSFL